MKAKYKLNCKGEFVIENYNFSKPFANFFPGIAGPYGIPIWAFYVNRGQAISSFGIKNKDHGIVEFYPANKAWQVTPLLGFRTFIKIKAAKKHLFYEPFHNGPINANFKLANRMRITSSDLTLEEENSTLGLTVKVEYFTIPNDKYGALARVVTLKNTGKAPKNFAFVDGLPQIMPFGMHGFFTKEMSRTIEAWMYVNNLDKGVPFYRLAVDPQDRPEVIHITEGNFYLGFHYQNNKPQIIKPMIDPQSVFGPITDFTSPYLFLNSANFKPPKNEISSGRTPCAFSFLEGKLTAGEEKCFYSVCGYMLNQEALNSLTPKIIKSGYIKNKQQENKTLIENIQEDINTQSSKCELDLYAKQTYLDNILRGGYPVSFKSANNQTIFYLYSRKHGDLERDYNRFQLQPTYLSQGNGNYRDISQNRRSDIWFNPDIKDENVISFFNLLQTDGFNPLVVKGTTFTLKNPAQIKDKLNGYIKSGEPEALFKLLEKPFTPGDVIIFIEENKIKLDIGYDEFLGILLTESVKHNEAEHGEGFWTDHWTYNLDLLENYLSVYPENKKEIIFDKKAFTFFDNVETVKPRSEKYMLYSDSVKQLHSIGADLVKKELIHKRSFSPHLVRKEYGIGEIYQTTLINKLLSLVANKIASLDPFGMGIEMEADKPNWYDSLNGLPALFGSSLCETLELKRYILFIKNSLIDAKTNQVTITEEILHLLNGLNELALNVTDDYLYWDQTHTLKEEYRHKTKLGLSGNEIGVPVDQLINILDNFLGKLDTGIKKAYDKKSNVYYAYFYHEVSEYEPLKDKFVKPLKFTQKKLPFFLESQVHALKITDDIKQAKMLYKGTRNSELFDTKLKMYKVCAPLKNMPEEIGRCRVFNPGWLENESIWLHMEYKYLLELLRAGLNDEFYSDFKEVLVPFQKADKYGRNILENSSFLVSSAFVDKNLHGNGFVARLSGSTAEFLSIWLLMNCGRNPFFINEKNELNLRFTPLLSGWLFDKKGNYSFNFLSKIKVTFHNPKKKNTFGANAVKVEKILFNDKNGKPIEIFNDTIPAPYASQIRSRLIKTIDIYLE